MRFFFNVLIDDEEVPDFEGTDLANRDAAQAEAYDIAEELRRNFSDYSNATVIEVRTLSGERVFSLPVTLGRN